MAEVEIPKLGIASEYLDAAIEFFLVGRNYFCAIHLSAAAEELFGAHLPEAERISTLAWKAEKAVVTSLFADFVTVTAAADRIIGAVNMQLHTAGLELVNFTEIPPHETLSTGEKKRRWG